MLWQCHTDIIPSPAVIKIFNIYTVVILQWWSDIGYGYPYQIPHITHTASSGCPTEHFFMLGYIKYKNYYDDIIGSRPTSLWFSSW